MANSNSDKNKDRLMKKVGVVYFKESGNVGDDVQTLCMVELIQRLDPKVQIELVDRESLNNAATANLDGLIVNGWFMDKPQNWPPNNSKILFVSMHINSQNGASQIMQKPDFLGFYKNYEPIGCRDKGTRDRFRALGIQAYFSGCATLTLKARPRKKEKEGLLAIDPFYKVVNNRKYQMWRLKQLISKKELANCELLSNDSPGLVDLDTNVRLANARKYVNRIADASCVITSRIHAALPALAVETQVIFIDAGYDRSPEYRDRFDGIIDFFNVIDGDNFRFVGRSLIAKIKRALLLDKLFDNQSRHKVLIEARADRGEQSKGGVQRIQKEIEGTVKKFLTSL